MQPSSLVFLVIIAVWAAYFVQYWVRRREHLATARSVDQFSESMRVLERRSPLPVSNLSTPQPRSYAVTPARAARPQVLVKRAETAQAAVSSPQADEPPASRTNPAVARRNRAMIMLGALSTVVVAVPLVALSLLPLPVLLVPLLSVGGAVAWARAAAQAERRSRVDARQAAGQGTRQSRPARAVTAAERAPAARAAEHTAEPTALEQVAADVSVGDAVDPDADAPATHTSRTAPGELYDVQAVEADLRRPAAARAAGQGAGNAAAAAAPAAVLTRPLVDEDDIPLTWDPVPVPRPTYTMKSRVTRPAPTSADLVGDADTEYAAYEDIPERRFAGA